ncbi:MAG: hypothetical protein HKN47_24230 [Pirellulaceae bacterium]|nr:hypothetical protein [Pirellulaceae bacterium]
MATVGDEARRSSDPTSLIWIVYCGPPAVSVRFDPIKDRRNAQSRATSRRSVMATLGA